MLVWFVPAANVGAQTADTPTPAIIFVTATPSNNTANTNPPGVATAAATAAVNGTAAANASDAAVPREKQALRLALVVLGKKLGRRVTYVKQWTWELDSFNDSALGCPDSGQTPQKGFAAGYKFVITWFDNTQYEYHVSYDLSHVYTCGSVGAPG